MNKEASLKQAGRHLGDALDADADCLVTPCPLCHLNLDLQQPLAEKVVGRPLGMPVLHLPQMVGLALRARPEGARAQQARRPPDVGDRLVDLGRRRRPERRVARYAWPAAVGAAGLAWYGADSLRHRRESGHGYDLRGASSTSRSDDFLRAAEALTGAPVSWGNDVELLINGDRIFPCYLETIREAQQTVCLLTYVYWRGDIAHDVADALCERARAGVECNVLIDAVGGMKLERELIERMTEAGVRVRRFRPVKAYAARAARATARTARSSSPTGASALTGGVGIAEEWTGDAEDPDHWRDTHVRVDGPVVRGLFGAFAENWLEATGEVLVGDGLPARRSRRRDDGGPMMVVRSSAGVGDSNVEALYYLAIAAARESLDLTAAYFVPRPAFIEALQDAAERGVRVRVLVPGREHRQAAGLGRRPRAPTTTCSRPASRSTSTSRRCCTRRR